MLHTTFEYCFTVGKNHAEIRKRNNNTFHKLVFTFNENS